MKSEIFHLLSPEEHELKLKFFSKLLVKGQEGPYKISTYALPAHVYAKECRAIYR